MRTNVQILLALFVIGALTLGCAPAPAVEPPKAPVTAPQEVSTGTLTIAKADEANSIDPHVHDGWYSVRAQSPVYETLVDMKWNPDKKVEEFLPHLASEYTISPDGLTYTFKLRRGVKFHDGSLFTAEAVKVTFDRNKAMKLRPSYQVAPIKQLETPDDYTVIMRLERPDTPFLMAMARAYIMSPKAIKDHATADDPWAQKWHNLNAVGTGPYLTKQFVLNSISEYVKNPDYWGGWAGKHFDRIVLKHVAERTTQALLIEKGEADIVLQVPFDELPRLAKVPDVDVHNYPGAMPFVWELRHTGALADVRVRQALAYATDYDSIIKNVMSGTGSRIYSILYPGFPGYCEKDPVSGKQLIKYDYNPDKAKALLKEAGYEKGLDLTFTMPSAVPFEKDVAVALQGIWAPLGIRLKIEEVASAATYMSASYTAEEPRKFDAFGMLLAAYLPDPDHLVWRTYSTDNIPGLNASYYKNALVDEVTRKAKSVPPGPERDALYCQAHIQVNNDAVNLFMFLNNDVKVFRKDIKGYVYNPLDLAREFRFFDMYREK